MGEIIKFPGSSRRPIDNNPITGVEEIAFIAARRSGKHSQVLPSGTGAGLSESVRQGFREVMEMLSEEGRRMLAEAMGEIELGERTSGRQDRHGVRAGLEDRWWDAHRLNDLSGQIRIETEIGERFGPHRGGRIVDRLRMVADIHEIRQQT